MSKKAVVFILPELPNTLIFLLKWLSNLSFTMLFLYFPKIIPGTSFIPNTSCISFSFIHAAVPWVPFSGLNLIPLFSWLFLKAIKNMLTIIKIEIIAIIKQIVVYKVDVSPILLSKHKLKMWKYFLILTSNIIFKIKQKNKNM